MQSMPSHAKPLKNNFNIIRGHLFLPSDFFTSDTPPDLCMHFSPKITTFVALPHFLGCPGNI
jgi:hypothetical protein